VRLRCSTVGLSFEKIRYLIVQKQVAMAEWLRRSLKQEVEGSNPTAVYFLQKLQLALLCNNKTLITSFLTTLLFWLCPWFFYRPFRLAAERCSVEICRNLLGFLLRFCNFFRKNSRTTSHPLRRPSPLSEVYRHRLHCFSSTKDELKKSDKNLVAFF